MPTSPRSSVTRMPNRGDSRWRNRVESSEPVSARRRCAHVSKKYLPPYLNEFQFRFNNRKEADIFGKTIARYVARLGLVSDARFPRDVTTDNPFLGIELKGFKMEIPAETSRRGQDRGDKRAPEGDQLPAFPRLGPAGSSPGERLVVLERINLSLRAQCCVQ